MTGKDNDISIWFFIGISLLGNGLLITAAGAYEFIRPPQNPVVLYQYHANLWWGALLLIFGLIYCVVYAPGRAKKQDAAALAPASIRNEEIHAK